MSCGDAILCALPQARDSSASSFESCHHRRTATTCIVSRTLATGVVPLQDTKSYEGDGGEAPPVGVKSLHVSYSCMGNVQDWSCLALDLLI